MEYPKSRFGNLSGEYIKLRDKCLEQTVRWEFSTGPLYSIIPLWNERLGLKKGKTILSLPENAHTAYEYGFDEAGHLTVIRQKDRDNRYEEYITHEENRTVTSIRYQVDTTVEPIHLGVVAYNDGRVIESNIVMLYGKRHEQYQYDSDGNMLIRICVTAVQFIEPEDKEEISHYDVVIEYDPSDNIQSIDSIYPNGYKRNLYRVVPQKSTKSSQIKELAQAFATEIPTIIAKAAIAEQSYAIVLAYDTESEELLPPILGIGLESERRDWKLKHGAGAKRFVWNPAEFSTFDIPLLAFTNSDLISRCNIMNAILVDEESGATLRKLLNSVAATLAQIDWREILQTTDNFVVYAVDLEGSDLVTNLRKSVPPDLLKRLKRENWL